MTDNTFAARFSAALASLGITQAEAARRLKCSPGYVNQLVTGRREPVLDAVWEYATTLGIDPHSLDRRLAGAKVRLSQPRRKSP